MALTVPWGPIGSFDPYTRDHAGFLQKMRFADGSAGTSAQQATARAELDKAPDFRARAKTTDNSAASEVIDLTDEGVTFPAATLRRIVFRSKATTDNDSWMQEWEQYVWGNDGTTPKLVGSARLINAVGVIDGTVVQYGAIAAQSTYAQDTATAVAAASTAGSSLGNNSTNTVTLTHPIARTSPRRFVVNAAPDVATNTEQLHASVHAATSTTASVFLGALVDGAADGFDDAGTITVQGYILPPPSIALVMNSNNVEVHCGHDATDDVYHDIEVFVGKAESVLLTADPS